MMATTFEEMVLQERNRLVAQITDIEIRQRALQEEMALVKRELSALDAYETAKAGKKKNSTGRRTSRQDGILQLLQGNAGGMTRGGILEGLGLKGNKSGEQSISNALNNMKKAGTIAVRDGKYVAA